MRPPISILWGNATKKEGWGRKVSSSQLLCFLWLWFQFWFGQNSKRWIEEASSVYCCKQWKESVGEGSKKKFYPSHHPFIFHLWTLKFPQTKCFWCLNSWRVRTRERRTQKKLTLQSCHFLAPPFQNIKINQTFLEDEKMRTINVVKRRTHFS